MKSIGCKDEYLDGEQLGIISLFSKSRGSEQKSKEVTRKFC